MPKQITQAELRAILDDESAVNRQMIRIRERIRKGATVEPGELGARIDGSKDFDARCGGYCNMGLDITAAEYIERFEAAAKRFEAESLRSKLTVIRGGKTEVAYA